MESPAQSRALQELRVVWLALGLLLGASLPATGRLLLGLTVLPWLVGGGTLLLRQGRGGAPAFVARLSRGTGGRMTVLVVVVLAALLALLTTLFFALLITTWAAAASLVLAPLLGPERLLGVWQVSVTLVTSLALVSGLLEGILRLPPLEERYGRPPATEARVWDRRYDGVAKQNVFGLRSVHQNVVRTPGVLRILALGDSYTWGEKVRSTDSIWPSLLEAELRRRTAPGWPTEVVNLSRAGWSTVDEARALEALGWQFQPDRVVLQFYLNDHDPPVGDPKFMHRLGEPPAVLKGSRLGSSALVYFLRVKYWATVGRSTLRSNLFDNFADGSPGWTRVSGGLHQIAASARKRGVPVTLVLFTNFPHGHWTPTTYPYRQLHAKVARAAAAEGMDVLDLTWVYAAEGKDWSHWWATPYDPHPNSDAHLVAARAIARHLTEHGWGRGSPAGSAGRACDTVCTTAPAADRKS